MNQATLDTISQQAFDQAIEQYISWASEWDGALPADIFFPHGDAAQWRLGRLRKNVRLSYTRAL